MKECVTCKDSLPLSDFHRNKRMKDGHLNRCKACTKARRPPYSIEKQKINRADATRRTREWQLRNPERFKENNRRAYLKRTFGITLEEYEAMVLDQGGVCAICRKTCSMQLAVDHCHATGRVRGLLCGKCNRGIGLLGDTKENLAAALDYLSGTENVYI